MTLAYQLVEDANQQMEGQTLLDLYRQMYLMRRFEEEAARAYTERKIGGFLHLYIGQEALAAGVMAGLQPQDNVISTYRIHAQYLARGGNARAGMAELYGKATGCAGGRGGSMHFFDREHNFMGGWGIVGQHVPIAAGAAFAAKYRGDDSVTVCFLGDGAVSIGGFHEGMCLAALWKLPVVYIVENNQYAMGTPLSRTMITEDASLRALGYPMARATAIGVDVNEVYGVAKQAIDRARNESMPMLLEFKTYRYRGHSMADPAKYRTKEELNEWKEKDPLLITERHLQRDFPHLAQQVPGIQQSVEDEMADAVEFAENSPEPELSTIGEHTFVNPI